MRLVQAGTMLVGALVYVGFVLSFLAYSDGYINPPDYGPALLLLVVGWNALLLVVSVLVIIDSVKRVRKGTTARLEHGVFVVKLAAIPFFLLSFALLALFAVGGMAIFILGGMALLLFALVGSGLTYLAMLSTSVYGWASVVQLRRERRIETKRAVVYSVLLCLPVADTVVGILLFRDSRRRAKAIAAISAA